MRDWLNSILGQDGGRVAQFALALVAVVLLILLLAWVVRRLQPGARLVAATGGKARKRLGVLEASDVDARRRLVLVRRDEVEHLIMIGGPNDLLIESRILRSGHAANRPNAQHMPRPVAVNEAERYVPPLAGSPPTALSAPVPASLPTSRTIPPQPEPAQIPIPQFGRDALDEEPELPLAAPAPSPVAAAAPQFAPPPFEPAAARAPVAPTPPTASAIPDPRRPSLSDLLNAATAAKVADPRDLPRPVTVPPPMPRMTVPQPDLEEDDRDMPTQIVAQRPPQPAATPAPVVSNIEPPASRESDVATQIERALSDLNPLSAPVETQARIEPRLEPALQPVLQPQMTQQRRPVLEPAPALTVPMARPTPIAAAPTMPPIPPRPTPPTRPVLTERPVLVERPTLVERPVLVERPPLPERPAFPERPALPERPAMVERPALPERAPLMERPVAVERIEPQIQPIPAPEPIVRIDDRAPTGQTATFTPTLPAEPVTAPRPVTAPVLRPPIVAAIEPVAPQPAAAPPPPAKPKTDELEEEMAKLLSELGGTSSR